jgi:hypothetical protein
MSKTGVKWVFRLDRSYQKKALYGLLFPFFDPGNNVPWEFVFTLMENTDIMAYFQKITTYTRDKISLLLQF